MNQRLRSVVRAAFGSPSLLEPLEPRLVFNGGPGDLDPTFNQIVQTTSAAPGFVVDAVRDPATGNSFLLTSVNPRNAGLDLDVLGNVLPGLAVTKVKADGTTDPLFGFSGRTTLTLFGGLEPDRILLQPDGKLLVYGGVDSDGDGSSDDVIFYRLNPDGQLDSSLNPNTNGYRTFDSVTSFGNPTGTPVQEFPVDVAFSGTDKLVVLTSTSSSNKLFRLNLADLSVDTSFGAAGITTVGSPGLTDILGPVFADSSSRIYVGARDASSGDLGILRFTSAGATDTTFLSSGAIFFTDARFEITFTEITGSLLVAHAFVASPSGPSVGVRAHSLDLATGGVNTSFGSFGDLDFFQSDAFTVSLQRDTPTTAYLTYLSNSTPTINVNKLDAAGVVSGFSPSTISAASTSGIARVRPANDSVLFFTQLSQDNAVFAYLANGQADPTFNPTDPVPGSILLDLPVGGISEFAAAQPLNSGGTLAIRVDFDLSLQQYIVYIFTTANANATSTTSTQISSSFINSGFAPDTVRINKLPDGSFFVLFGGPSPSDNLLMKLTATGAVDTTFGSSGFFQLPFTTASAADVAFSAADNRFYVLATNGVLAFTAAGPLDTTFGTSGSIQLSASQTGRRILALPAGGIVLAYSDSSSGTERALLRSFLPSGAPDPAFFQGNPVDVSINSLPTRIRALIRLSNGQFAIGGSVVDTTTSPISNKFFVNIAAVTAGVGLTPYLNAQTQSTPSAVYDLAEDPNLGGGIFAVGTNLGAPLLIRLTLNGFLDTNFGVGVNNSTDTLSNRYNSVYVDSLGRPIAAGYDASAAAGRGTRLGSLARFNASNFVSSPTALIVTPVPRPTTRNDPVLVQVTYTPAVGRTLDLTTAGANDLTAILLSGAQVAAAFVSASSPAAGSGAVTVTYSVAPPAGGFSDGRIDFFLTATSVADDLAQFPATTSDFALFTFPAAANLIVSSVTGPAQSLFSSASVSFSVTLANSGGSPSDLTNVTISLVSSSGDATFVLGTVPLPTIAVAGFGTVSSVSSPLSLPSIPTSLTGTIPLGVYFIRAEITSPNASTLSSASPLVTILPLPVPVVGGLDPTFGNGTGTVTTTLAAPSITTSATLPLAGGLLLSAGFTSDGNLAVFRTLPTGLIDTTFGPDGTGRTLIDLRATFDVATAVAIDSAGRFIVAGYSLDAAGGGATCFLVRLTPAGVLDTTFATAGVSLLAPATLAGNFTTPRALLLDAAGRPLVAGTTRPASGTDADNRTFLARANPDGSLDTSFGSTANGGGSGAAIPVAARSSFNSALLLPDGKILAAGAFTTPGQATSQFLITRLLPDGTPDLKFAKKGTYLGPVSAANDRVTTLALTPGKPTPVGALYVGGVRAAPDGSSSQAVLFRLTSKGALDKGFAKGLAVLTVPGAPLSTVTSVIVQDEGRVLVGVTTAASASAFQAGRFGVTYLRRDLKGAVDPFFNAGQPLTLTPIPVEPAAAQPVVSSFDDFASTRQGQAAMIEGKRVRSVATRPVAGDPANTQVRVDAITPDGIDLLAGTLSDKIKPTVLPGFKGTTTLLVSNRGSLPSAGTFSVQLIARPVAGGADIALKTLSNKTAVKAGASLKLTLPIALAKTTTPGAYTLLATLTPTFAELSSTNNTSTRPQPLTIAAPPVKASSPFFSPTPDDDRPLF